MRTIQPSARSLFLLRQRSRSPVRRSSPPRRGCTRSPRRGGSGYSSPPRGLTLSLSRSLALSVIVMVTVVVMVDTSSSSCCSSAVPIGKLFAWGEGDSGGHVLRKTSRGLCVPRPPGVVTRTPPPPPGVDQGCYVAPTSAHFLLEQIAVLVCCPAAARMLLHASPLHMLELPRCQRPSRELREGLISWSLH
jgi:hypothetical protein